MEILVDGFVRKTRYFMNLVTAPIVARLFQVLYSGLEKLACFEGADNERNLVATPDLTC
jgi:hypothetical protein